MKYKPDESTLISWLYGELDETETAKLEAYFNENPEERKKAQQMQSVRKVLSAIADKEVIAPPVIHDDQQRVVPMWRTSWFRASISIAASFILIIVAGKLLGTEITYADKELKITFGTQKVAEPRLIEQTSVAESLTEAQIQEMINTSLRSSEERVEQQLTSAQARLDRTVKTALASAPAGVDSLARQLSRASESQVRAFVTGLREENLQMMRQYLDLSASEQRAYMENLLVDFSKWQSEQRSQDLQILMTRVNRIENNTNQLKEETEQILASIISNSAVSGNESN